MSTHPIILDDIVDDFVVDAVDGRPHWPRGQRVDGSTRGSCRLRCGTPAGAVPQRRR